MVENRIYWRIYKPNKGRRRAKIPPEREVRSPILMRFDALPTKPDLFKFF